MVKEEDIYRVLKEFFKENAQQLNNNQFENLYYRWLHKLSCIFASQSSFLSTGLLPTDDEIRYTSSRFYQMLIDAGIDFLPYLEEIQGKMFYKVKFPSYELEIPENIKHVDMDAFEGSNIREVCIEPHTTIVQSSLFSNIQILYRLSAPQFEIDLNNIPITPINSRISAQAKPSTITINTELWEYFKEDIELLNSKY